MPNNKALLSAFTDDLGERTDVKPRMLAPNRAHEKDVDALVRIDTPAGKLTLAVEMMRTAYPRDIHYVLDRLRGVQDAASPVVLAETLSPGAKQTLRDAGVGYYESNGTMYLRAGNWLIDIERPPVRKPRRPAALFTGAREQVIHAVLHHWLDLRTGQKRSQAEYFSGAEIATMAGTSPYTVSQTLQELERHEFVESIGSGPRQRRRLCKPDALLDDWVRSWKLRQSHEYKYFFFAPGDLVQALTDKFATHDDWALTGAAAANATVPYLTSVARANVIVPPGAATALASVLELEPVEKGANVVLMERQGASWLFVARDGKRSVASPFIQYLDLLDGYGRNKELAMQFRRTALHMESPS